MAKRPVFYAENDIVKSTDVDFQWYPGFPLEPRTCFYDYLYYLAVKETLTDDELKELTGYNHFTDIEFSPEKSLNTQARSVVMIKLIYEKYRKLPEFSPEEFIDIHRRSICK